MSQRGRSTRVWLRGFGSLLSILFAGLLVVGAVVVNVQHLKLEPVLSGSMRPHIQPGDLAVIRPTPVGDLIAGDVVAYLPPGQATPVLHRVIDITREGFVTQGDANTTADPWGRVKPSGGTVASLVAVVPKVGWLIEVRTQVLSVAAGIILLAAAAALWSSVRKARSDDPADDGTPDIQPTEGPSKGLAAQDPLSHTIKGEVI